MDSAGKKFYIVDMTGSEVSEFRVEEKTEPTLKVGLFDLAKQKKNSKRSKKR